MPTPPAAVVLPDPRPLDRVQIAHAGAISRVGDWSAEARIAQSWRLGRAFAPWYWGAADAPPPSGTPPTRTRIWSAVRQRQPLVHARRERDLAAELRLYPGLDFVYVEFGSLAELSAFRDALGGHLWFRAVPPSARAGASQRP